MPLTSEGQTSGSFTLAWARGRKRLYAAQIPHYLPCVNNYWKAALTARGGGILNLAPSNCHAGEHKQRMLSLLYFLYLQEAEMIQSSAIPPEMQSCPVEELMDYVAGHLIDWSAQHGM